MADAAVRVVLDPAAIASLAETPEAAEMAQEAGDVIADRARDLAPKRTGAGAASIRADVGDDEDGYYADVSWDADHFYMGFAELGTERQAARPFLRPALDESSI